MVRIKKLGLSALAALALTAGGLAFVHEPPPTDPDPVAWSLGTSNPTSFVDDEEIIEAVAVYKKGSFDNTEAEQLAGGKDPEYPTTPGVAGGKDPEIPVTTG